MHVGIEILEVLVDVSERVLVGFIGIHVGECCVDGRDVSCLVLGDLPSGPILVPGELIDGCLCEEVGVEDRTTVGGCGVTELLGIDFDPFCKVLEVVGDTVLEDSLDRAIVGGFDDAPDGVDGLGGCTIHCIQEIGCGLHTADRDDGGTCSIVI